MEHGGEGEMVDGSATAGDAALAVAELSRQLAHPLRVLALTHVSQHGPCPFSELVEVTGQSQAQVSNHLAVLRKAGLLVTERQGRQSLYRLPNAYLAEVLANLRAAAGVTCADTPDLPGRGEARGCYDHVGGHLGVGVLRTLIDRGALVGDPLDDGDLAVGPAAGDVLPDFGVAEWEPLLGARRRFAYGCPDWTEKAPHLGGALGAAVAQGFLARQWIRPRHGSRRLDLTALGREALTAAGVSV
ncbi:MULTISPECIES: ArsR/SmtB family transcription factor [Streptomyces]|nr:MULTISPECIES: metalloregulator ArsR/SmtB family transcription factor [Streptomyces]